MDCFNVVLDPLQLCDIFLANHWNFLAKDELLLVSLRSMSNRFFKSNSPRSKRLISAAYKPVVPDFAFANVHFNVFGGGDIIK